ncbi:MAG: YbaK/EbsC family protein [Pirellulaceae bacterium]
MNIDEYLLQQNVEYDVIPHRETHDAQRMAQVVHVSGREVAKTVLLRAKSAQSPFYVAVLPANKAIDFEKAEQALGGVRVELATRQEVADHCPDCEFGALPPFGSMYRMPTIVDQRLAEDEEIVFEGNTHRESIRMQWADFLRIEQPQVVDIAIAR